MLAKSSMQLIQDLKQQGYTPSEILDHFLAHGEKPPSRPTIQKYYVMDVLPEHPAEKLEKDKVFDVEPFRSAIIQILETNDTKIHISSVYDVLEERFVESEEFEKLPENEQTLRNYVHYLRDNGFINTDEEHRRVYDHVFDTPPGQQMLVDFGEVILSRNKSVHFICGLLRYSRYLCVIAQDHKFNSFEACSALYRIFCRIGGRPEVLVIDQDAVFVADETYGEVKLTRTFNDFCEEQDLKLWVCNKADPESKGPIENSVGFVKKNFFSARMIEDVNDVWRSLPGWLHRKDRRIHKATFRVPQDILDRYEAGYLRPLKASVYESSPNSYTTVELRSMPYVQYASCHYSVPYTFAYKTVHYKVVGNKIHIYDKDLQFLVTHTLCEVKGTYVQLPEHKRPESTDRVEIMERLRSKWNGCQHLQHFLNGVKSEDPRHIAKQLGAIEQFLDAEVPSSAFLTDVLQECCEQSRYKFSQFKQMFEMMKAERHIGMPEHGVVIYTGAVDHTDLSVYGEVFAERSNSAGVV